MWSKARASSALSPTAEPESGRPLAATERAVFTTSGLSPLNLVVLVRLDGPALDDVLPDALAALRDRHPLLRARIVGPRGRPRFEVSPAMAARPGVIPLRLLAAEEPERAFAVAEAEMNTSFDPAAGPLARFTCVRGPGTATDLVLTLHHAIADGTSTASLVHELLDQCRARLAGEVPARPAAGPLPARVSDLLPAGMRGLRGKGKMLALLARECADEISVRLGSRSRPVPPPGRAVALPVEMDAGQTTALVDRARRQRLTMTSVLAAGLLWQASAVLYHGRPATMRAVIWVDLRPYLDPPVGADTLGCYISFLRFPIRVDPRRGFTALAGDVQGRIERASRRGDRLTAARISPAMTRLAVRWPVSRLGTVALSHTPAAAMEPEFGPLSVREVRAFVSNNRIGADLAAASGVTRGTLWCDLLYLDSDYGEAAAAAMGDGLLRTLREFAGLA